MYLRVMRLEPGRALRRLLVIRQMTAGEYLINSGNGAEKMD